MIYSKSASDVLHARKESADSINTSWGRPKLVAWQVNYYSAVVHLDTRRIEHRKFHQPMSTRAIHPSVAQLHISNPLEFLGNQDQGRMQIHHNQETVSSRPSS